MTKFQPVRGMRDFLPQEANIRYVIKQKILQTYQKHGFNLIETPVLENLDFLIRQSENSDNQKLIFKILKRGEKLNLSYNQVYNDINNSLTNTLKNTVHIKQNQDKLQLADLGMRFDLTVPLMRYYATHKDQLPKIFHAIQIGEVWRAERPQSGRYRQFVQCDIDIIGSSSLVCEFELLITSIEALSQLISSPLVIKINSRQLLQKCLEEWKLQEYSSIFLSCLDKIDKIGLQAVQLQLENALPNKTWDRYLLFLQELKPNLQIEQLLTEVSKYIKQQNYSQFSIKFDPYLVRGMGYYTGTIFEIVASEWNTTISGGGRYDNMLQDKTPACGISLGFERIIEIIQKENKLTTPNLTKLAIVTSEEVSYANILEQLKPYLLKYDAYNFIPFPTNKNAQSKLKWLLQKEGYTAYILCINQNIPSDLIML